MKSICIKTRNQMEIENFINKYEEQYIENTKISLKKFKIFYNFIIHFNGEDERKFLYSLSIIISEYIIDKYEKAFIKKCINRNYFYFDEFEKDIIFKISTRILQLQELEFQYKKEILSELVYDYILTSKSIFIEGFSNFRIKEYLDILDYVVELSVMNYIKFV